MASYIYAGETNKNYSNYN